MKLTKKDLKEAIKLRNEGVDTWSLSQIYSVHYDTMRRYLRQYDLYGVSIFTPYPQYVEKTED